AFVTDTSLAEAVSFLRSALGDDPQAPRFIQTVHRRGYRFLVTPSGVSTPRPTDVEPGSDRGRTGVRPGSDPIRGPFAYAGDAPASARTPVRASATENTTAADRPDWSLVPWSIALLCAGLAAAAVWYGTK